MSITHIDAAGARDRDVRAPGLVGPNAITRVAEALAARFGKDRCRAVFAAAGLERRLVEPPLQMVDEREVARLHGALIERLGAEDATTVSREAGRLTGDYLLANRIPRVAWIVLPHLPSSLSSRILCRAIARHAWTFVGSGAFSYSFSSNLRLQIVGSPICRGLHAESPACHYFAATFERVFSAMLGRQVRVTETACVATGAPACLFDVRWREPRGGVSNDAHQGS